MKKKLLLMAVALVCTVGSWADTAILSSEAGWSKITSLPATLSDYYFVFVDKNNDLMLFYNTGTVGKQDVENPNDKPHGYGYKTMFYSTSQDPTQNRGMLWEISSNNNGYSLKSAIESTYYIQTENNAGWYCHTHDNGGNNAYWYKWLLNYDEDWTIENGVFSNNYIGPWDAASFAHDSEVAGNKTDADHIGHFYIYAIRKIDANVLSAIRYLESRTDNIATITSLRTKYSDGTYTNATTSNDVYNDYKALEVAALSSASAGNYTSALINPSFESGNMTGWTAIAGGSEAYPFYLSDVGARAVGSDYPLSNADGDYVMNYYAWSWSCDPVNGIQQTIPNLPAGTYRIEAVLGGWVDWKIVLDVNATYQEKTMTVENQGEAFSVDVTLASASDLTITAKSYASANTYRDCFLKADNFRIYNLTHYYDELNAAINAAKAKTLGFEVGEYAPYNNVTAINAIAEAEDVDQDEYMEWSALKALVSKLTSWTVNTERMNAFYKGDFAGYTEDATTPLDYTPTGWTASANFRAMLTNADNYPGLADASATHAVMSWAGGITYGETAGYTMPLEANNIYRLTFDAAGWNNEDRSDIKVSVLNSSDGLAETNLGTPDRDIVGNANNTSGMTSYEVLFVTGAAGNYVFHIGMDNGKNMVITDFELRKATININEDANSTQSVAGTANVTLTRNFNANAWNSLVLPFDMTLEEAKSAFGNDIIIANYTGTNEISTSVYQLQFSTEDASITANEPVLIWGATSVDGTTISDREIKTETPSWTPTGATYSFVGSYAASTTLASGDYFIGSDNNLYSVGSDLPSMKGTRAFFRPVSAGAKAMSFEIDGDETGIMLVDGEGTQVINGEIYNLAGQRVNKAQKGIYIINGKKVLVK